MKITVVTMFLLLGAMLFPACASHQQTGQSQVREAPEEKRPAYGQPAAMDDWKQRGAGGYPADNDPRGNNQQE